MAVPRPASLVYDGLWTMLEAHSEFTDALVAPGNRVKFTSRVKRHQRSGAQQADLPQLALLYLGVSTTPEASSNSSFIKTLWSWEILSGSQHIHDIMEVEQIIWEAMHTWRQYIRPLQYKGKTYTTELRTTKLDDDLKIRRDQRVKTALSFADGWISSWIGYVDVWLASSDYLS